MLVVGGFDESLIDVHKRTRKVYSVDDYRLLKNTVSGFETILVTPHVLAETSALLNQMGEPKRTALAAHFAALVQGLSEAPVSSKDLVARTEFVALGLADVGLLEKCESADVALITADLDLYLEASKTNPNVLNFNHLRAAAMYS